MIKTETHELLSNAMDADEAVKAIKDAFISLIEHSVATDSSYVEFTLPNTDDVIKAVISMDDNGKPDGMLMINSTVPAMLRKAINVGKRKLLSLMFDFLNDTREDDYAGESSSILMLMPANDENDVPILFTKLGYPEEENIDHIAPAVLLTVFAKALDEYKDAFLDWYLEQCMAE